MKWILLILIAFSAMSREKLVMGSVGLFSDPEKTSKIGAIYIGDPHWISNDDPNHFRATLVNDSPFRIISGSVNFLQYYDIKTRMIVASPIALIQRIPSHSRYVLDAIVDERGCAVVLDSIDAVFELADGTRKTFQHQFAEDQAQPAWFDARGCPAKRRAWEKN